MLKKAHVHMTSGALAVLAAVEAGATFIGTEGEFTIPVVLLGVAAALSSFVQVYEVGEKNDTPPAE